MSIPPFASDPPKTTSAGFPTNDRTWFADVKAAQAREQREVDELANYELLGAGMAAFCLSFWHVLGEAQKQEQVTFSRDEQLRLLEAALRGR